MIVWWGEHLRFLYNDAYLPLLGNKHPALMLEGDQVWGEIWDIIGPMLDSVMRTGQATWSEDLLLPMDRHGYWEETYWTYSYSPLHDDDGTVRGVFTAVKDTTEEVVGRRRLAVLQELGALAGQARSVTEACDLVVRSLEGASDVVPFAAVYLRGPDGNPVLAGSSALGAGLSPVPGGPGGWPAEEVLRDGRPVTLTDVIARFGELPSGGWKTPPAEAMVLPLTGGADGAATGAIVLAASAGRALDEAYASFLGLVAQQTAAIVNRAVAYQAQLRRAEELAELDRAKTTFFSNVSHEFRTPLTLIMGPVEELRARIDPADAAAAGELDVIYRNGVRLGKLVNTLLDFSRLEAGRMQASFEPLDLGVFTTELASVFESAFERAGLGYEVDCPPLGHPRLRGPGDVGEGRLQPAQQRAEVHLRRHGQRAARRGGRARGAPRGGHRHGYPGGGDAPPVRPLPPDRERPVPVQRGQRHRARPGPGAGRAARRHDRGGQHRTRGHHVHRHDPVRPRPPAGRERGRPRRVARRGRGRPPVPARGDALAAVRRGGRASARRPPPTASPGGTPAKVLLADDNADMREYLQRLLEPSYQVTAVTDGQAALEAARASPPDILISDVMMPRLGGLQLVAALRADLRTAGIPVLLLSARAGQEASIEGLEAGADDYLVKPFAAAELLARVRANLDLARLRTHHARWRAALLDSLHEAFYLVDEDGNVVEVNAGFTDLLGFGPEGLPYPPRRPWWPDEQADPEGHRLASEALERLMTDSTGGFTVPLRHRDGRRVWVTGSFNEVTDPENGRRMVVGTFRDVTAEHYAVQREAALGAMGLMVSRAGSAAQVLQEALGELARLWRAPEVTAATWTGADQVTVTSTGPARSWDALPAALRNELAALRDRPVLTPAADRAGGRRHQARAPGGHARDLDRARPGPAVQRRGPHPVQPGRRLPRPGPAPRLPDRPAARDGAGPAARHPGPVPAARRVRRPLRARHPPARGRRRLVRHRRAAGRPDRHHGRRLRRARPRRGHRDGPAAQRLPRAAAPGRQRGRGPDRHGPVRVVRAGGRVRHRCSAGSSTRAPVSSAIPAPVTRRASWSIPTAAWTCSKTPARCRWRSAPTRGGPRPATSCRPGRRCCSTPTAWSSGAAGRSPRASPRRARRYGRPVPPRWRTSPNSS